MLPQSTNIVRKSGLITQIDKNKFLQIKSIITES